MPPTIPLTLYKIDLSKNPSIEFRPDYFTKFARLKGLNLEECSISHPVYLPHSIRALQLSHNSLNFEAVRKMFAKRNLSNLREADFSSNRIRINKWDGGFSAFPKQLTRLDLSSNKISRIERMDLKRFSQLRMLHVSNCGITGIEAGSFDSLKAIHDLRMSQNKLTKLPAGLFKFNKKIVYLYLSDNALTTLPDLRGIQSLIVLEMRRNKLTHINTEELGVKWIRSLYFGENRIHSFDLSNTAYSTLELSRNNITFLRDYAFPPQKAVRHLFLHNNNISYISKKAFKSINEIGELFLQHNKLKTIERGLFKNISIGRLYLFRNNIEKVDGILDGVRRAPNLILLFGNPNLTYFRASDYKQMRNHSVIYIGCTQLTTIKGNKDLLADVKCSPSNDLKLITTTSALMGDGFSCKTRSTDHFFLCKPCPVGHAKRCDSEDCQGPCLPCPAGSFYQDEMATTSCKLCPPGQYVPLELAPGKNSVDCKTCPKNTNTNDTAGYRACSCLPGYARSHRFGACEKCREEGLMCKRDYPELKRGYWMTWESIKTTWNEPCKQLFKQFMLNLDTSNDTYNRSTINFTSCRMPTPHKCPISGSCVGGVDASCKPGYTGVLCSVCAPNYMKQYNKCTKCPSRLVAIVQCVGYALSFLLVCWLISFTDEIKLADSSDRAENERRTFADIILSSLKILMGFYQVVSGLIHALSYIHWPHSLKSVMGIFEYIQLEILRMPSLNCIKAEWRLDAVSEFWVALIATFAVPFLIFLYFAIKTCLLYFCSSNQCKFREMRKECLEKSLRSALLFLFSTYTLTCRRIVQILPVSCHTLCTAASEHGKCLREVSYLRCDYSIGCLAHSDNTVLKTAAYVALLIPVSIPLLLFLLLWRFAPVASRKEGQRDESSYSTLTSTNNSDIQENGDVPTPDDSVTVDGAIRFALRFAFENYKESCWYWEVLEMIRKLIMTVGIVLFLEHTKVGLGGIIIISTVFTLAQAVTNPIKDRFENTLQLLSVTIVPINLSIGAILRSNKTYEPGIMTEGEDSFAVGVLLIILNSLLISLATLRFIRAIALKIESKMRANGGGSWFRCCLGFLCHCTLLGPIDRPVYQLARNSAI